MSRAAVSDAFSHGLHAARRCLAAAWLLAAALGAACTSMPAAPPRAPQQAVHAPADAPLVRLATASLPAASPQLSGLQLLVDGDDALATRLMLARLARHTLDVQYYQIAADAAGLQFLRELRAAAQRGVRVRLLVDDLHAGELQELLAALAAEANFEVRLFNPLPARHGTALGRVLASLHEFDRINRRMHNKLFIADQSVAVTGGRNIGDEYFMRAPHANFFDLDVVVAGAVLPELGAHFDAFWNHRLAYDTRGLLGRQPAAEVLRQLPAAAAALDQSARHSVCAQIGRGRLQLHTARARVFADAPDKAAQSVAVPGEAMQRSLQLMQGAQREVLIASPYFVPGPNGLALMHAAIERGIGVQVLTNSLAATDEPLAHQGYARYRLDMLRIGVSLAELSPTPSRQAAAGRRSSLGRLHAKLAVVDRRWLLVGSMNMDLRSSRLNTELGLAVDSSELADAVTATLRQHWSEGHYQLRLDNSGRRIEWQVQEDGRLRSLPAEPQSHWWQKLQLSLLSMFIDEEHL
jgi:putative cardiolipin synthase